MTAHTTLVGNVTADPELRFTASGQAVCSFGVAVNRRWLDKQTNEWLEEVSFFTVQCWRQLAENAAESLRKGTQVIATGRLNQRSWEDNDGTKRYSVELVADHVGPSLMFATAAVERIQRSNEGATGQRQPAQQRSGNRRAAAPPAANYDNYDNEEPF